MTGGSIDDRGDEELAREPPSDRVLRWVLAELDADSVTSVELMRGSSTAAMHRVTVADRTGTTLDVVLRRYVLSRVLADNPRVTFQEWGALALVAPAAVTTPAPIAADLTGHDTGAPTIVMSVLAGRPQWEGGQRWLDQLVDALIEIHQVALPSDGSLTDLHRYEQAVYEPPGWSSRPEVWEKAFDIFHGPIPTDDLSFVHRDFHGGNTLWSRGRLTGVVDWQAACRGPASIDVGHFRMNLLYSQPDLAKRLRATWETRTGKTYNPWADVVSIVGTLDHFRRQRTASKAMHAFEAVITQAVAELGT